MANRKCQTAVPSNERDLFGEPIKRRRGRWESYLSRYDRDTFAERLERLKYLDSVVPQAAGMMAGLETVLVFQEATLAFVNGAFVATIMLAQAFVEHWLQAYLEREGFSKEADQGLSAIASCCRDSHLLSEYLLDKVDHLRQVRNPFTHLKPYHSPFTMSHRLLVERVPPDEILEREAREAIGVMYTVFAARLW